MDKLIGRKLKMTQMFSDSGDRVAITPIKIESGDLASLKNGDLVKVTGITKGKGYQGVMKRHGFHGGPRTHGQKNRQRHSGSIGSTAPQRVVKGRRMAGHMGVVRSTISNILVMEIKPDNLLIIRGAVPGNTNSRVAITKA